MSPIFIGYYGHFWHFAFFHPENDSCQFTEGFKEAKGSDLWKVRQRAQCPSQQLHHIRGVFVKMSWKHPMRPKASIRASATEGHWCQIKPLSIFLPLEKYSSPPPFGSNKSANYKIMPHLIAETRGWTDFYRDGAYKPDSAFMAPQLVGGDKKWSKQII